MDAEKQVVSLELAKRLKELGIPQESLFYWVISLTTNYHLSYTEGNRDLLPQDRNDFYAAFTVAELGEMLPGCIMIETAETYLEIAHKHEFGREYGIRYDASEHRGEWIWARTEADARAKMLIYLTEQRKI